MFELALDPTTWAILCAVALAAGFIDAIAGGGAMYALTWRMATQAGRETGDRPATRQPAARRPIGRKR